MAPSTRHPPGAPDLAHTRRALVDLHSPLCPPSCVRLERRADLAPPPRRFLIEAPSRASVGQPHSVGSREAQVRQRVLDRQALVATRLERGGLAIARLLGAGAVGVCRVGRVGRVGQVGQVDSQCLAIELVGLIQQRHCNPIVLAMGLLVLQRRVAAECVPLFFLVRGHPVLGPFEEFDGARPRGALLALAALGARRDGRGGSVHHRGLLRK
mmetsp:Transcript_23638/g.48955  ORF Transcript_23638/g.48955 Transcript_23638/m.48955 type:complete len:212 (-) Transcript_23638:295-930(-)